MMDSITFERLRALVYEYSGISLKETKEAMVSARIAKRMRVLGINNHQQYLRYLEQDDSGNEMTRFLDVISTNVTSFFRESLHFDFLKDILSNWLVNGKTKIRVWSAAASTGEEALSIAMTIRDAIGERLCDFKILATDISTNVLAIAQKGLYETPQMHNVPEALRRRFFVPVKTPGGAGFQAREELMRNIVYRRLNLSRPPFPMHGQLDIVFCRNVMIYFDEETRKSLVEEIYRQLLPGGYLLTGHAESLSSLKTDFTYIRPTIYQKK
jgi:chemotaxis protein methyltransferase CheR